MTKDKLPTYGGQALIEGVMMRGTSHLVAAMRAPDQHIELHKESLKGIYFSPLRKFPFIRGLLILWDSFGLGINLLTLSANLQAQQDEEKIEGFSYYASIVFSIIIAVFIFFLSPALLSQWIQKWLSLSAISSNLLEGTIRLLFLVLYLILIGRLEDIRRVFSYHGAEHKTINAFEAGEELTPSLVKNYPLEHPRCGTSFMLTVVIFSIIIFTVLGELTIWERIISRVLLIPVIASLSYEYIRWAAAHLDSWLVKVLIAPNLLLQKLTTRNPDEKMLEVSISALKELISLEDLKK